MAGAFPDRAVLESALDLAARAPSPQNSQPWHWRVDRRGLHLHADWSRGLGHTEADRRDVLLSCGAVLDHCAVALAAAGWYPRVHRFPGPLDSGAVALFELIEVSPAPGQIELASVIGRRRSDRGDFVASRLPAGTLELLDVRAVRQGVDFGVVPRFRWGRRDGDGVALRFPGAGGAENGSAMTDGAVMVVLGTERDDAFARVQAGEALSQLLLSATVMGLASCTVTAPLHDDRSRLALACEVFDGAAYPQVLVRIGLPRSRTEVPVLSQRRTVNQTTEWDRS